MENETQNGAVYQLESEKTKPKSNKTPAPLLTIEQLKEICPTPASAFEAMKVEYSWASGLEMTQAEYEEAYENWLNTPIERQV